MLGIEDTRPLTHHITPVILCGGSGTRLWPLSTPETPKQFLRLLSPKSMIQMTADRVSEEQGGLRFSAPLAIGSKRHADALLNTLPGATLVLEPFGRNSAPAIAAACLACDPEEILLVLPADHDIANLPAFHAAISAGLPAAQAGSIVTFGIKPTHPATGYGYIKAEASDDPIARVEAFAEKPDQPTAETYLASGQYFWNAGIFMFRAQAMIDALDTYEPCILPVVKKAMQHSCNAVINLRPDVFCDAKDISIDYAVMERSTKTVVVPVDMGWSDVGGYRAIYDLLAEGEASNVQQGPVRAFDSERVFLRSEGPRIMVSNVQDLAVIATDEAVSIVSLSSDAAVKQQRAEFLARRDVFGVADRVCEEAGRFLTTLFDVWSAKAWDKNQGGFVEQLNLAGEPDTQANRRLRVQARQIFSFSRAARNGWVDAATARSLVEDGLDYLISKGRHPEGGWVHHLSPDGQIANDTRDLYDHAFVVLAGAAAWDAFKFTDARSMAFDTLNFLNEQMFDAKNGGWLDALPSPDYRRANPHMHLLEASMDLFEATGETEALAVSNQIVSLFERSLFRPDYDELVEVFDLDWTAHGEPGKAEIEPGHHYEWSTLLTLHQRLSGHDTLSWQRRLIRRADQSGLDAKDALAFNSVSALGGPANTRKRLWPQLEMLRARLLHPGLSANGEAERLFDNIKRTYIDGWQAGTWLDEIDETGNAYSKAVPASMLYHFATSFGMLAR
ncbi:MAG: AGE family epimerase/isomerase [Henriciella sp.]|uniref:AGE family epimerase/isomerase n=1 Tax=Henriciella sp. TaxID=1968823 RepID=UPI003C770F2F